MPTPILATKLYIPPPRPNFVLRPRLIERLNEGVHRKLTLISAPAGFGKTTLVSTWVAESERSAAWLSLDEGDNDLNQFLAYLIASLQTLVFSEVEGIGMKFGERVLEALESPPPVPNEPILTALVNEIAALPDNFILVLDDYHVIDAQPVDDAVTFLLEYLPPQMHLVIATREDPRLSLARLRVRDHLTEIGVTDLRFTHAETSGFLNQLMGLNLSVEDVSALETRTEGWIAGLQLAAISMKGQNETSNFIQSFTGSHRFVLDYLVEEILHQQSESVQDFLLRTSILDRLSGPLCDAVLGHTAVSGQSILENLERANLLVVPLDNERQWYRYHHLFADALQARLEKEYSDQVLELHRRASLWHEKNNFPYDAIRHVLASEDFERAADLIELVWSEIRRSCFRSPTWLGWVNALPEEHVLNRPVINVGYAWEHLNFGDLEAAEAQIRVAERWLEPEAGLDESLQKQTAKMIVVNEDEFPTLRGSLASIRAYHAQALGDIPGTIKHAHRALALITDTDHITRGLASLALGFASWTTGDLKSAHQFFADGIASLQQAGNVLFANGGTLFLAEICAAQGLLQEAVKTYQQALHQVTGQEEAVLQGSVDLYLGLSALYREQGDLASARQNLAKSEELGQAAALPDWKHRFCLVKARLKQSEGDLEGALGLLDEAEQVDYFVPVPYVRPVGAMKARIWIAQGKLSEAQNWATDRGLSIDDELSYLLEFENITLARLLIALYKYGGMVDALNKASGLLARLLKAAQEGERKGSVIEILILQALALHAQRDIPAALKPLAKGLALAEQEGYVHLFVDEGAPMAQLLSETVAQEFYPAYAETLLADFEGKDEKRDLTKSGPIAEILLEPLSQREKEVLQLIAQGLSNREISERLFLALNTVKGHNRKIFAKLQVQRRTEAVARARELDLL